MTLTTQDFDESNLKLLKDTICKGSDNNEFQLFIHACKRTGLDPFARQIYAVKRWDSGLKRETMAVQVGIDGYRLVADRTGKYAPGRETTFVYDKEGKIISATAYVKKQTQDGTWHEISATAFFAEYVAYGRDKQTQKQYVTAMWATKPHIMISKCAEALAIRKAFPAELSGIYTAEEMSQADNAKPTEATYEVVPEEERMIEKTSQELPKIDVPRISKEQNDALMEIMIGCDESFHSYVDNKISKHPWNAKTIAEMPLVMYEGILNDAIKYRDSLSKKGAKNA